MPWQLVVAAGAVEPVEVQLQGLEQLVVEPAVAEVVAGEALAGLVPSFPAAGT